MCGPPPCSSALRLSLTRRLLVATVFVTLLVTIIVHAAAAKHQAMNMSVHAYDLFFYLSSISTLSFLWASYRAELLLLLAALSFSRWSSSPPTPWTPPAFAAPCPFP